MKNRGWTLEAIAGDMLFELGISLERESGKITMRDIEKIIREIQRLKAIEEGARFACSVMRDLPLTKRKR